MSVFKFETGKHLLWQPDGQEEREYIILRHLKDRMLELQDPLTGLKIIENANNLHVELKKGKLRILYE